MWLYVVNIYHTQWAIYIETTAKFRTWYVTFSHWRLIPFLEKVFTWKINSSKHTHKGCFFFKETQKIYKINYSDFSAILSNFSYDRFKISKKKRINSRKTLQVFVSYIRETHKQQNKAFLHCLDLILLRKKQHCVWFLQITFTHFFVVRSKSNLLEKIEEKTKQQNKTNSCAWVDLKFYLGNRFSLTSIN